MDLGFPHIKYISNNIDIQEDKKLYYIGNKYPELEKMKRYLLRLVLYSPSIDIKHKPVWVVYDINNNNAIKTCQNNRIHSDLNQFTDDISDWRDKKIENILKND